MAITKEKKEEILKGLVDKFGRSKSVVFADYRGLDVASISELRSELRKEDAEMKVAKKTLIGLAAKETVGELDESVMEGPVVATFSYEDPLSGIRILFKFSKKNENLKLLGGIIDGKMVGPEVIQQYAKIPSREELLAKLIGSMNSPISGFVGIGNSLIGGIVRALSAYKDTLPAEAAPAPEAPAPAEPTPEPAAEDTPQSEESESGEATENSTSDDNPLDSQSADTPEDGTIDEVSEAGENDTTNEITEETEAAGEAGKDDTADEVDESKEEESKPAEEAPAEDKPHSEEGESGEDTEDDTEVKPA